MAANRAAEQWLRTRGDDHAADLVEVAGVGGYLIGLWRFAELDAVGRLPPAARVLGFLDTVGRFGQVARRTLLAGAVEAISADPDLAGFPEQTDPFEAREALVYMHGVLTDLAGLAGSEESG